MKSRKADGKLIVSSKNIIDYPGILGIKWAADWANNAARLFNESFACLLTRGYMVKELIKRIVIFGSAFFLITAF